MSPEEQDELAMRWLGPGSTYEKLGLPCSAYKEQVNKTYRELIKKLHPDKNKSTRADEAFKVMSNEVKALLNVNSRRMYDEQFFMKSRSFRIYVKSGSMSTNFLVCSSDTISVVKDKLVLEWAWLDRYDQEEMFLGRPGWHLDGRKMKDGKKLHDYGVKEDQVLYLVLESLAEQDLKKELKEKRETIEDLEHKMIDMEKERKTSSDMEQQLMELRKEVEKEREKRKDMEQYELEQRKEVEKERKRSEDMEQQTVELSKEIDKERDTSNKLKQQNLKVEQELVELRVKVTNAEGLQQRFKLEIVSMKNKLLTANKKKPKVREQASRVSRISTQEEEEKNQADMDYEPEKPYPRAKGKRKRQADSDSEEEAASSLTGSLDSSPGGGDTLEEQDDLGSPDDNEDREQGFISQEVIECQGKTEEDKNDEETKRNEPRICKLKSQKGSKDLNQNKEGYAVLGGCEKRSAEEGGNYAVGKLAKKLEVKKGKTVKAVKYTSVAISLVWSEVVCEGPVPEGGRS